MHPYNGIPTWDEIVQVRGWVMAGCPAGHLDYDAGRMVRLLWKLMEGLPKHISIYAYGSDEWRAELARIRKIEP